MFRPGLLTHLSTIHAELQPRSVSRCTHSHLPPTSALSVSTSGTPLGRKSSVVFVMDTTFRANVASLCSTSRLVSRTRTFRTGIAILNAFVKTSRLCFAVTRLTLRYVVQRATSASYGAQRCSSYFFSFVGAKSQDCCCDLPPEEEPAVLRDLGKVEL